MMLAPKPPRRIVMARRRERPIPRINPSGEKVWVARATDRSGKRQYLGTFTLKREAQDAIDAGLRGVGERPGCARYGRPIRGRLDAAASALRADELRPEQQASAGARRADRRPQAARLAIRRAPPQSCPRSRRPHAHPPKEGGGRREGHPASAVGDGRGRDRRSVRDRQPVQGRAAAGRRSAGHQAGASDPHLDHGPDA